MDSVGAGTGCYVDHATVEAAKLRGHIIGFDGELRDIVKDREEGDLTGFGLKCGDAIVDVLIGPWAATVNAGKQGAGRQLDAWRQRCELNKISCVERNGSDNGAGDISLDVAGLRLQERSITVDGYSLPIASGTQREIKTHRLSNDNGDALTIQDLEARCFYLYTI